MTNNEFQMTNQILNPNDKKYFDIRISSLIRHSSFEIRYFIR